MKIIQIKNLKEAIVKPTKEISINLQKRNLQN